MGLAANWKRSAALVGLLCTVSLQGCRAQQRWPLWEKYSDTFIDSKSGRVIDHSDGDKTTSEGQAYAMFFALVVNDRSKFDQILNWTEENLAGGDLSARLPAWSWGKAPDGSWKVLDNNSASDADLWIAYDLLEAGRLWGMPKYQKLGSVIANQISHAEVVDVPGIGTALLPGAKGFRPGMQSFVLNPSYTPPQVLARLAQDDKHGPWTSIADGLPQMLAQSSAGGFAMDWVSAGTTVRPSPSPKDLAEGKQDAVAAGSYDAIRVYLWLGMANKNTRGVSSAMSAVNGMGIYLTNHTTPPLKVDGSGHVMEDASPVGFSAAVIPYLVAANRPDEAKVQVNRLGAGLENGLYGKQPKYYDQNLALFATGWMEGRFRFEKSGELHLKWN